MEAEVKFEDTPMRVVGRRALCEEKGCTGEMVYTGLAGGTFHHKCNKCGCTDWLDDTYPKIAFEKQS